MAMMRIAARAAIIATASGLAVGAVMLVPAAAMAGKVHGGKTIAFSAATNESNQLMVATTAASGGGPASATITEGGGVPLSASGASCLQLSDVPGQNPGDPPRQSASCSATISKVVLNVRDGDDTAIGSGNSLLVLNGGAGNDKLSGSEADDRVNGASGSDVLVGGQGSDVIVGGGGNDQIDGADGGVVDRVRCGGGIDVVATDLDAAGNPIGDKIGKDCEQVVQKQGDLLAPPADAEQWVFEDSGPGLSKSECAAVSSSGRVSKMRRRRVGIRLQAPRNATLRCLGSVRLDARVRARRHGRTARTINVKVGSTRFSLAPGQKAAVKVKLTKRGARLLGRLQRLRVRVSVRTRQQLSGRTALSKRIVTLKAKRQPHRGRR